MDKNIQLVDHALVETENKGQNMFANGFAKAFDAGINFQNNTRCRQDYSFQ